MRIRAREVEGAIEESERTRRDQEVECRATLSTALSVNDVDPRATMRKDYSTLRY